MKQSLRLKLVFALLLTFIVLGIGSTVALARPNNTITVNSTDDTWNPGDGKCTLREAINNANTDANASSDCAAGNGADVIVLPLGETFTLTQVDSGFSPDFNALPVITSDITINGAFSSLTRDSTAADFRIFKVNVTGKLTLNDLVLGGGSVMADGGGIFNAGTLILNNTFVGNNRILAPVASSDRNGYGGGGIYNLGHLTLNHATIYHNTSGLGGALLRSTDQMGEPGGDGGGVYNGPNATADIQNSSFSLNQTGIGGKLYAYANPDSYTFASAGLGGAIYSEGTLHLDTDFIDSNETGTRACQCRSYGGGIAQAAGEATMTASRLFGNIARFGGGLYVSTGNAHLFRSLIEQNHADDGAALYDGTAINPGLSAGSIYVLNSTLAHNTDEDGVRGAYSIVKSAGTTEFNYSTIADNTVSDSGGAATVSLYYSTYDSNVVFSNVILSNSTGAPNCSQQDNTLIHNAGNNIDSGTSCDFGSANHSQSNTDSKLSALADNGGPTWTMAIAADSPARDMGNIADCTNADAGNNVDQRGFTRIQGVNSSCDIGAYEYGASASVVEPTETNTPTVTPTNVPAGSTKTPVPPTNTPTPTNTPDPCPTAPVAPTLTSPINNTTVTTARVLLKWSAVTCATTYNVTVKLKNKVVDSATGLTTLKFKTKALTRGKTYTWFVQACNAKGCTTSTTSKFKN
jgi:CSLREA domain-containing protein